MSTSTEILGHPKGLFVCFATEMWERFSYYGMRALLILYLTKHWEFSDAQSYIIYGAYTSLVYIMPVFGGMLADRILGSRKAVTFGAILLVLGHTGMAFESSLQLFYLSLALIISGVGFLKPKTNMTLGNTLRIYFLANKPADRRATTNWDLKRSGDYLIYATKHSFTVERYDISITCAKMKNFTTEAAIV